MNIALAAFGGHPVPTWESEEGVHTPSGSKTPIIICGWLLKMKREHRKFRSTWNRRWFTVEDGAFHWYKTSSSDACGRLSLMDIQSVRRYVGTEHGSFTFVVHTADREMLLRADTANDESRWLRGLTLQTDLVHGGTFQGPPSAKNRRRTVLKLMGEGCCAVDDRGGDGTNWDQKGEGKDHRGGGWKGEGNQYREINDRIRAIMDDQDAGGRRGGGTGPGTGGTNASTGGTRPPRYYSNQLPPRKSKITPRDPRGISIVGGRGLGKFRAKAIGGGETGDGDRSGGGGVDGSSPPMERSSGGGGGGSGGRRFSYTTSKVVPIVSSASPGSYAAEGAAGEALRLTDASGGYSSDEGRWPVVNGVGVGCEGSGGSSSGGGSSGGGSSGKGRPRPPLPSGPPPANARAFRSASGRVSARLEGFDSTKRVDDVGWGARGGTGGGGGGGKIVGSCRRKGAYQTNGKCGGAGRRRGRHRFESHHDRSSSEESSSRTRGDDPFMGEYDDWPGTDRGSTPSQHPLGSAERSFAAPRSSDGKSKGRKHTAVGGAGRSTGEAGDRRPEQNRENHHHHHHRRRRRHQRHRQTRKHHQAKRRGGGDP
ncbi:unnamed protein product, partial [Scytosiphon promiscuus]